MRARDSLWRPSMCSTPAQTTVSLTRIATSSSGTRPMLSMRSSRLSSSRPGGTEGLGAREQQLDPLLGRRAVGHQAQRGAEPSRGARGRTEGGRLSGLSQDRQRGRVAVAGGLLDVVRSSQREAPRSASAPRNAHARREASRRAQSRRRPCARAGGGTGTGGAPRCCGRVRARAARRARPRPPSSSTAAAAAASSGSNGSPATAAPPSSARVGATAAPAPRSGQPLPPVAPRRRQVECWSPGPGRAAWRSAELLEVERVAAALLVEAVRRSPRRLAEELGGLVALEAAKLEPDERPGSVRPLEGARPAARGAASAGRPRRAAPPPRAAGAGARRAARSTPESAQCTSSRSSTSGLVAAPARAAPAPRDARGSARPGAPAVRPSAKSRATERRARARRGHRLRASRGGGDRAPRRIRRGHPRRPRTAGRARAPTRSPKERCNRSRRRARQLREQAGLADARLSDQHERGRFTALEPGHGSVQSTQLRGAPNEVLKDLGQPGIPSQRA